MLGPGSRILATTRDELLLTRLGVHGKFQAEELNYWESFQLFNWYAFGMVDAREGYLEVSIRAVEHAGGVPLALKALGSFLRGRSIDVWKRVLEYLEKKSSQGDPENTWAELASFDSRYGKEILSKQSHGVINFPQYVLKEQ